MIGWGISAFPSHDGCFHQMNTEFYDCGWTENDYSLVQESYDIANFGKEINETHVLKIIAGGHIIPGSRDSLLRLNPEYSLCGNAETTPCRLASADLPGQSPLIWYANMAPPNADMRALSEVTRPTKHIPIWFWSAYNTNDSCDDAMRRNLPMDSLLSIRLLNSD